MSVFVRFGLFGFDVLASRLPVQLLIHTFHIFN